MKTYLSEITQTALILGSAGFVLGATTVHADDKDRGFYLGGDVGVNWANHLESNLTSSTVALNAGVRGDIFVGYAFGLCDHLTLAPELEVGAIYNSFGDGSSGGQTTSGGGDLVQVPVLANAVLTYKFAQRFSIYGGFGVGVQYSDVSVSGNSPIFDLGGNEGGVCWQAKVGVQCRVGPGDLGLGYKYLGYSAIFYNNLNNNTIEASYTIHF